MNVTVQNLCPTIRPTSATHYANPQITLLYLNDGSLFQSQSVSRDARGKYAGGFWGGLVAKATFNTVCVLGAKLTD